jgi:hypothetical protein
MNLKNQRAGYWIILGAVLLLVGVVGVFCSLRVPVEPIIPGIVAQEELPKIQAAVRDAQRQKFVGALRTWTWRKLPSLAGDCLRRPIEEVTVYSNNQSKVLVLTRSNKGSTVGGYVIGTNGAGWKVVGEIPPGLMPFAKNPGSASISGRRPGKIKP